MLMDWTMSPWSPKTPKVPVNDDETLAMQLQNLIDEWCYKCMESSFARTWTRRRVLGSVLDILELFGLPFAPGSKEDLLAMPEEEMVANIVSVMPQEVRNSFENIAAELKSMHESQCQMRSALDSEDDGQLKEILDDGNFSLVTQLILKQAVVHASAQVAKTQKVHFTWRQSTEKRIDRLMCAAEKAEHAHQQLLAVEAQLATFQSGVNTKSRQALMAMVGGNSKTLMHSVFSTWKGVVEQVLMEASTRQKFEQQIKDTEARLMEFQGTQLKNIKGLVLGFAARSEKDLLSAVVGTWRQEVDDRLRDGTAAANMADAQSKLKQMKLSQVVNAKQMMFRFASDSTQGLVSACMQAWISHSQEYKKEQETEDAVKETEARLKAHLAARKDDARRVLDRLATSSESGLLSTVIQYWLNFIAEEKSAEALHAKLAAAKSNIAGLYSRHGSAVHGVTTRVTSQLNLNLIMQVFMLWRLEVSTTKAQTHYSAKMENKRRQLHGVNSLFKTFAQKLEEKVDAEVTNGEETPMHALTTKPSRRHRSSKGMEKTEATLSLPDIHSSRRLI